MIDIIKEALEALNIREYLIREIKTEGVELFFIKKSLDVRRMKDTHLYETVVYNEFFKNDKKCKGNAIASIYPGMTRQETEEALKSAFLAASFAVNEWYELPVYDEAGNWLNSWIKTGERADGADTCVQKNVSEAEGSTAVSIDKALRERSDSRLSQLGLSEGSRIMTEALFAEDRAADYEGTEPFINSAEMFLVRRTHRMISCSGADISYVKWKITGEYVTQCKKPRDVEIYADFEYDDLKTEALRAKVRQTLDYTSARTEALKAPKAGKYDIIISGSNVKTMFEYYLDRSGANFVYAGYPHFSKGSNVGCTGKDELTLTLKADVPYSNEGIPMKDRRLIDRGILQCYHGNTRFSYYIGEEPTGGYSNIEVKPGTMTFSEMKKTPYLHIVNFSDFQMDPTTGSFGGEIRLAFLYDGEKEIPVTGGSINGKIFEAQKNMEMSVELQEDNGFTGPFAIKLKGINVAGE